MKTLLLGFVVLSAVTIVALFDQRAELHRTYPVQAIGVKIVEANGWTGSTEFLPAKNGYNTTLNNVSGGMSGGDGGYAINGSYQVASSSPGHFFVLAHYKITQNGRAVEVDKALPVLPFYEPSPIAEEKLKQATWTNLDNHLWAFAYMSDTKL